MPEMTLTKQPEVGSHLLALDNQSWTPWLFAQGGDLTMLMICAVVLAFSWRPPRALNVWTLHPKASS